MTFYVIVTVVSVIAFGADMVLRYMEKIRSFGMEQKLHNIKGRTIPIEDLIPNNITMLTVFLSAFGIFGIFLKLVGFHPFVSFPLSVAFGCMVNFTVMHFVKPFFENISGDILDDDTDVSGYDAVCTQPIGGDDYGRVELVYKDRKYEFDAISENETDIAKGEAVYVLYREGGVCVVEKQTEILDVINEKDN